MEGVEMDISFFQDNEPPEGESQNEEYSAYMDARAIAIDANQELNERMEELVELQTFSSEVGGGYMSQGLWNWVFTFEFDYDSEEENDFLEYFLGVMDIQIFAEKDESAQTAAWIVSVTGCVEEDEDNPGDELCIDFGIEGSDETFTLLRDHKLMDGEVSLDLASGEWNLYLPSVPETETEYLNLQWDFESEQVKTFNTVFTYDALLLLDLEFMKNSSDYRITHSKSGSGAATVITWNSDTGEGSLETDGLAKVCWGSDLQEVACL